MADGSGAAGPDPQPGLTRAQLISAVAGAITAVALAIAAVIALVDGEDGTAPTPTTTPTPKATLAVQRFERQVTQGEFATRFPSAALDDLSAPERARRGGVAHLDLTFEHFEDRRCTRAGR